MASRLFVVATRSLSRAGARERDTGSDAREITMRGTRARRSRREENRLTKPRERSLSIRQPGELVCPNCVTVTVIGEKVEFLRPASSRRRELLPSRDSGKKARAESFLDSTLLVIVRAENVYAHYAPSRENLLSNGRLDVSVLDKTESTSPVSGSYRSRPFSDFRRPPRGPLCVRNTKNNFHRTAVGACVRL